MKANLKESAEKLQDKQESESKIKRDFKNLLTLAKTEKEKKELRMLIERLR